MAGRGHHGHRHHGHHEQTFNIFCGAVEGCCLTVRHDAVVLAPTEPHNVYQHWVKKTRHSTIKDEEGHSAFALVNKATGKAIKHSKGEGHPVRLVPYNSDYLSVLWTDPPTKHPAYKGFHRIRMVNNINLNFHVEQYPKIVLRKREERSTKQYWKIEPRPGRA